MSISENRLSFRQKLVELLGSGYKVYFQPPEQMQYPCIVYERRNIYSDNADNIKYLLNQSYMVTVISRIPDDSAIDKLLSLQYSRYISHSIVDNLYHDTFEIYY